MRIIVIISSHYCCRGYLCLGDFMARLRDPDKAIVYLNQVEEHIKMEQDGDTNWVHSMLDEENSMLDYCKTESMKKKKKKKKKKEEASDQI